VYRVYPFAVVISLVGLPFTSSTTKSELIKLLYNYENDVESDDDDSSDLHTPSAQSSSQTQQQWSKEKLALAQKGSLSFFFFELFILDFLAKS
jgi:hypothetical protein